MSKRVWPWQKGFGQQKADDAAALEKAKKDLEDLGKSKTDDEPGAMDLLEKALAEFSETDDLSKSNDGDDDDKGDDGKGDDGKGDDDKENELEKARQLELDALEKGGADDLEQELVRASLAFEGLTKSIEESSQDTQEGLELLAKGLGSVTELVLSVGQGVVAMHKSLEAKIAALGTQPAMRSGATFGMFKSLDDNGGDTSKTSVDECRTILIKAMEDGTELPAGLLSRLDTKRDTSIIPAALAEQLHIKL
jgi:hypothetical protein